MNKKVLKGSILAIGLSLSSMISVFGAGSGVTIRSIEYVDTNDVMRSYELKKIPDEALIKRERSQKDFVGYATSEFKTEQAYKTGKDGIYIDERFMINEDGTVQLYKEDYSGIVEESSTWFMDVDGRWYAFSNGTLITQSPIFDRARDTYYVLNPMKDELGALIHRNGFYNINGKIYHLTFDNTHNGIYGACIYGVEGIK